MPVGGPVPYRMLLMMTLGLEAGSEAPDPKGHPPTVGFDPTLRQEGVQ